MYSWVSLEGDETTYTVSKTPFFRSPMPKIGLNWLSSLISFC